MNILENVELFWQGKVNEISEHPRVYVSFPLLLNDIACVLGMKQSKRGTWLDKIFHNEITEVEQLCSSLLSSGLSL